MTKKRNRLGELRPFRIIVGLPLKQALLDLVTYIFAFSFRSYGYIFPNASYMIQRDRCFPLAILAAFLALAGAARSLDLPDVLCFNLINSIYWLLIYLSRYTLVFT